MNEINSTKHGVSPREFVNRIMIYPFLIPHIVAYFLTHRTWVLDQFYVIRSTLNGPSLNGGLKLALTGNSKVLFPVSEDANFDDVFIRNVYYPFHAERNDIIFDVGAHMGFFTVKNAKNVKRVLSFEPDPFNFGFLKNNIKQNALKNVDCFNIGLGDKDECLYLKMAYGHGRSSISKEETGISVPVKTIDSLTDELMVAPTVIKIDTEGYEMPILKGAIRTMERYSPTLVIAAYHYPGEIDEVTNFLRDRGYSGYIYSVPLVLQTEFEKYVYAYKKS